MVHAIHRVTAFAIVRPYTLNVTFDDGTQQTIDFEPVLRGVLFGPLQNRDLFSEVRLDAEAGTLVWPNGADFDPATLHDWPQTGPELARRAAKWDAQTERQANQRMEPTRR